jgi:alkylation response protein AidB-like acyl-CoA dehydrogenase
MDFSLSEEQELLRKSSRDFLGAECPKSLVKEIEASEEGYSPDLWKKMADLGWMGLALPEEYGGAEFSLVDLAVLFEEFGRAATPGPMFCTVALGALPVLDWGSEEQKKTLLPGVASGDLMMTMALSEPEVGHDPRFVAAAASSQDGGFSISGTKVFVPYAHVAAYSLVVCRTAGNPGDEEGLTVLVVDGKAAGTKLTALTTIAGDRQFEVAFDKVAASSGDVLGSKDQALAMVRSILRKAAALQCAQMVGGAQMELEITADRAKNRIQFNRPIGTFQAVQHRLADMFIDVNGARWTTYQAVWRLSEGLPAEKEVAVAKAFANIACQRVAFAAQHLHGGLGVDMDYDLHFYFRRAKAYELSLGTSAAHLKDLEVELGL